MSHHHDHEHDHAHEHGHQHGSAPAAQGGKAPHTHGGSGCSHGHSHGHGHDHGHHHHHGDPNTMGRAFAIAILLNSVFVAIEFGYGFLANSTALMADAGHNLSDVLGLMLAWGAAILAKRLPNGRYTYGLRSSSMLAALFNAMLLMVACGGIAWEAVQQLIHPDPVGGLTVSVVAGVGILINGFSAWLFMAGSKDDVNIRGAYLHMAADAAISLGVLVAGVIVMYTGWNWLDPLVSMLIVGFIVYSTWALLKQSLRMVMAAVPDHIEGEEIAAFLSAQPGVSAVQDLHIWAMSTTETALTVQLVTPQGHPGDAALDDISRQLREEYSIHHATLQVRLGDSSASCSLQTGKNAV
ncbi:cation diffusion facilitator family transporter [Pseudoduganella sp. FT93W]|uniref:Cation diffusion facilitator family transporter n=1 Tax=Duganella fentianensis TaxID=2692177 RepID=A0A845HS11_9BURK|nr:cation diffusion facilitator family transporter [Duganella fentianensis]MYN43699.1 cation diffusion facilitator family transporter [Duganella fentianensis]